MNIIKSQLLENVYSFLNDVIYPVVNELDINWKLLRSIYLDFCNKKFLNIYFGNTEITYHERIALQIALGRWGGAFSFLQSQTSTAIWLISQSSEKYALKYLTHILSGKITIGNTLSYSVKYWKAPTIIGKKTELGFLLNGVVPFASGWKIFDYLLIGFTENNCEIFALLPFKQRIKNPALKISEVLEVISMESLQTVSITFQNYFLPKNSVVASWRSGTLIQKAKHLPPLVYPIGISEQLIHLMDNKKDKSDALLKNISLLKNTLYKQKEILATKKMSARLNSQIISLASCCSAVAIMTCGGMSLLKKNEIQRLYRELPLWLIPRVTPEIINYYLDIELAKFKKQEI